MTNTFNLILRIQAPLIEIQMIYNIKLQRVRLKMMMGESRGGSLQEGSKRILSTDRELASQSNVSFTELKEGKKTEFMHEDFSLFRKITKIPTAVK